VTTTTGQGWDPISLVTHHSPPSRYPLFVYNIDSQGLARSSKEKWFQDLLLYTYTVIHLLHTLPNMECRANGLSISGVVKGCYSRATVQERTATEESKLNTFSLSFARVATLTANTREFEN
jgi:hypothetical protein